MTTTPSERAERRQAALTREAIAALVRAAIDEGIASYRRQYAVQSYTLEAWLAEITKRTTGELDLLLSEALVRKGKHAAWPAMVAVVEATHRPSSYLKDFYYHDRETVEQKQPAVFAWSTRDTGTWFFVPGTGRDSCLGLARAAQGSGQEQDWYWWNGQTLAQVDAQTALARLVTAERTLARREKEEAARAAS
jgi:hypothetical protein